MVISFGGDAGLFYAVQTLEQLLPVDNRVVRSVEPIWSIPAVRIVDKPRFQWRGMHLDVSRHFFDVRFIKRYIEYIAMHKMNVFHWHLIDDGGWRMETRKYPLLTSVGGWRAGGPGQWSYTDIRMLFDTSERPRYGGFYTQDEIREVVKYAAERYVTVVPEIELPGHTTPSIVVYPDLGCDGVAPPLEKGRTNTNVYCAGKEGTFMFLEDVLTETMELFPSRWIHIGGDEVNKAYWSQCPQCQKRMSDEGLRNVDELQSYFIKRIERFLVSKGRRLVGWDEILEGGLAPEATVMSWRGVEGGIAAAKSGHDVVMSPTSHCYFDYSYATTPTEHVYGWEPVPASLTAEEGRHVLGGQANVWTEYIPTVERCEYMIFPRMLATAEVLWTPVARRDWDSFSSRLMRYFGRLDAMGAVYQIPAPTVGYTAAVFVDRETVSAGVPLGSPFSLRYTTDGSAPTASSAEYRGALTVTSSQVLTFALVSGAGNVGDVARVECVKTVPLTDAGLAPGLTLDVYEGKWARLPDFSSLTPRASGSTNAVSLDGRTRDDEFGLRFSGFVKISVEGVYRFRLGSDDGSRFVLAGATVVDNDGLHGYVEREGAVRLLPGVYPIEIGFFEAGGAERLTFSVQAPGGEWGVAPAGMFLMKGEG
jgi:hexosaminidase